MIRLRSMLIDEEGQSRCFETVSRGRVFPSVSVANADMKWEKRAENAEPNRPALATWRDSHHLYHGQRYSQTRQHCQALGLRVEGIPTVPGRLYEFGNDMV